MEGLQPGIGLDWIIWHTLLLVPKRTGGRCLKPRNLAFSRRKGRLLLLICWLGFYLRAFSFWGNTLLQPPIHHCVD